MPFAFRLKIAYSYFVLTWLALLAFFFRLRGETPTLFLWIASILLLVMGLSYLWLCHWSEKFEEIFP